MHERNPGTLDKCKCRCYQCHLSLPQRVSTLLIMMTCRNCGGLRLKRLRRRSLFSRVMKVFGLGPWKCEMCDAESFGPSRIAGSSQDAI
jgi:hypothetical protein